MYVGFREAGMLNQFVAKAASFSLFPLQMIIEGCDFRRWTWKVKKKTKHVIWYFGDD